MTTASRVAALARALRARGEFLAAAESCTGGMVAAACTARPGSSEWFDRGFVTYSNDAKVAMLDVDAALIARHGAVSAEVARAMAVGAVERSRASWSVAITGVAGPGGGSQAKPVGTVWIAWARRGQAGGVGVDAAVHRFGGPRGAVRRAALAAALDGLVARLAG